MARYGMPHQHEEVRGLLRLPRGLSDGERAGVR